MEHTVSTPGDLSVPSQENTHNEVKVVDASVNISNSLPSLDFSSVKLEPAEEHVSFLSAQTEIQNKRSSIEIDENSSNNSHKKQKDEASFASQKNPTESADILEAGLSPSLSLFIKQNSSTTNPSTKEASISHSKQNSPVQTGTIINSSKEILTKIEEIPFDFDQQLDNNDSTIPPESFDKTFDPSALNSCALLDNQNDKLMDSPIPDCSYPQASSQTPNIREASNFDAVQIELKNSLSYIKMGLILDGFDILAKVTDVVVNNCEMLGLTSRENPHNINRLEFWKGLNNAWLFSLSRIPAVQSEAHRLTYAHITHLRSTVLAWGDSLSRYGLVDYELGLWESDLIEAIDFALNLYNPNPPPNFSVMTPTQADSPAFVVGDTNGLTAVKLEEDRNDSYYSFGGQTAYANKTYPAEEDSSQMAASAILTQLYNLINEPPSNSMLQSFDHDPNKDFLASLEMSPSDHNVSPENPLTNSPVRFENDTTGP